MQLIETQIATIGSRIEEYAQIASEQGMKAAKEAIRETYEEETEIVFEGLKIFMEYGIDTYYTGIISK